MSHKLVAEDGDLLMVNMHVDDEGRLIGATGHIEKPDSGAAE